MNDVTAQWVLLGVQLNVPYSKLQAIRCTHKEDPVSCMMEMINCWLSTTPDAKWSIIVQAIAEIGNQLLARKIAQNHGTCLYVFVHELRG